MESFRAETLKILNSNPEFEWLIIINSNAKYTYTYEQLSKRMYDYSNFYKQIGIKEGDIVLIILKESLDLFAGFFAAVCFGALPAYFAYPSPKQSKEAFLKSIEHLVKYNKIKIIISFSEIKQVLENSKLLQTEDFLGNFNFEEIQKSDKNDLNDTGNYPLPGREAFLQFSSGTTGAKKGVKISCEALTNQIIAYCKCINFDQNSKIVSWLPHYHDMGLIACMLIPFLKQVPIIMMSPFEWVMNPKILLDGISYYKGTHVWLPNFALGHLTKSIPDSELGGIDLSSIKSLVSCSEPVLFETLEGFIQKFQKSGLIKNNIFNCYAMAENTFAMTSTSSGSLKFIEIDPVIFQKQQQIRIKEGGKRISSVGSPLDNIKIKIANSNGVDLGVDKVGEVLIFSNCMLDCYYNNPEETKNAFIDGWFNTGDLGFIHNEELFIVGRKKDLIIIGGENIYPQDIELILNLEPYIIPGRNLAFGIEDKKLGTEKIVILAEVKNNSDDFDTTELRTKIFNALGISVSDIILLPHMTLLKGTAGKISRYLNKNEFINGKFNGFLKESHLHLSENTDEKLARIIFEILPKDSKINLTNKTPLLISGLIDSFRFIDLINSIEEKYHLKIPESYFRAEYFQTIDDIISTIASIKNVQNESNINPERKTELIEEGFLKRFVNFFKNN